MDNKPSSLFNVKLANHPYRQVPYLDDVQKYSVSPDPLKLYFVTAEQKELARKLKEELKKQQQVAEAERKKVFYSFFIIILILLLFLLILILTRPCLIAL